MRSNQRSINDLFRLAQTVNFKPQPSRLRRQRLWQAMIIYLLERVAIACMDLFFVAERRLRLGRRFNANEVKLAISGVDFSPR